jgi:hypothetical protein
MMKIDVVAASKIDDERLMLQFTDVNYETHTVFINAYVASTIKKMLEAGGSDGSGT